MESEISKIYGNQVRIRACGLCYDGDRLLLINHAGLTKTDFWAPPGGGVAFGASIQQTIQQEFMEEGNLAVSVGEFAFGCEFIQTPLHAVELFFEVKHESGILRAGYDPEVQIIRDATFFSPQEIAAMPLTILHGIFKYFSPTSGLRHLRGFYKL
jgi:8-oxo-dGTP diphosphatase